MFLKIYIFTPIILTRLFKVASTIEPSTLLTESTIILNTQKPFDVSTSESSQSSTSGLSQRLSTTTVVNSCYFNYY